MLFCLVDDAYCLINPRWRSREPLKRLSDSETLTLVLFQQLQGVESERSFLHDIERFCAHLFPGVVGLHPSSLHWRVRRLRGCLEPLRRAVATDLVGDPETLIADAAFGLASEAGRAIGGLRWSGVAAVGLLRRLRREAAPPPLLDQQRDHLLRTDRRQRRRRAPRPVRELVAGAGLDEGGVARRLFADLAYRSDAFGRELADRGVLLRTEGASRRPALRQQVEVCFATLKRTFGLGETLATTLVGLVSRIAAKATAYTPKGSTSIGSSGGRRGASRSYGPELLATLI